MITTKWHYGTVDFAHARALREAVFVKEQGFPAGAEFDETDAAALHLVIYEEGAPAATGRLYFQKGYRAGRICVLKEKRGKGLGDLLMRMLLARAFNEGAEKVSLGSQMAAVPFYKKLGFVADGPEYTEAGALHLPMRVTKEGFAAVLPPCAHAKKG